MNYEVIGTPRIEREYCDEYEAAMVIDLKREDGETGDVWIVAGVPAHLQGTAQAAGHTRGLASVRVFGDSPDMWCPESFRPGDDDYGQVAADVVAACEPAALKTWREYRDSL
jgi:hypothetical protein